MVQELPNGRLSLQHQGLYPDNLEQFAHKLDEVDRKLVKSLHLLSNQELLRKFAPRVKNASEFFQKHFRDEVQKTVVRYVSRNMEQVMPLLKGKALFIMASDGYPAQKEVQIIEEKASIRFHFDRREQGTLYYPKIFLRGQEIKFKDRYSEILCDDPAWMIVDQEVFTFDQAINGRKLVPFLKKGSILIQPQMEENYFHKFVPQLIEQYEVRAEGMDIFEVKEEPLFQLCIDVDRDSLMMRLEVAYGEHVFEPSRTAGFKVEVDFDGQDYAFFKVVRDQDAERDKLALIEGLLGHRGLMGMQFMSRQEGLSWLADHVSTLKESGIEVLQRDADQPINFEVPEIVLEPTNSGDWFDIRAVVHIGGFKIPFIKFKGHILKERRDYVLPDGSVVILPESWFADYRHLLEIAEERDGEMIAIRSYQAVVLDVPGGGTNNLKEKLENIVAAKAVQEIKLPEGLKAELRGYQKKGYEWMGFLQEVNFGGILADDMGLGKTLQTLSLLQREKESGNKNASLVVMPTSLVYNWMSEARKFTPSLRILVHTGLNRARHAYSFTGYDIVLTTYGIVRQDTDLFKDYPFHYLILDESQMIKNPASKTAKAVRDLKAKHRLSLTGTPLENSLMDLWSQMTFLNPGLLGSERFFRDFYAQPIERGHDAERRDKLRKLIHPFILRRTKDQVASELPPKVEHLHYCEMTDEQREYYEKTKNAYRNYLLGMDAGDFNKKKLNILAGLQKLRQIAIHPGLVEDEEDTSQLGSGKYEEFARLLGEVVSKGAKVLVFSQFVRVLTMLRKDLEEKGVKYCYLDGSTRDRQEQVRKFQEDGSITAFLISLKAGGVGLNLTAAEYVFIIDPWWNPAVEAQAVDRSHRIGQKKTVFSYKFITRDSIEEKIVKLQERKAMLSNEIVSVEEDIFKHLDLEELASLLD